MRRRSWCRPKAIFRRHPAIPFLLVGVAAAVRDGLDDALKDAGEMVAMQGRGQSDQAITEAALRSLAWKGRHLVVGFAAGDIPKIPLNLTLLKGASIIGVFWGAFVKSEPAASAENMKALFSLLEQGKLRPLVSATYPLERAADALNDMMQRKVVGKIVLATST